LYLRIFFVFGGNPRIYTRYFYGNVAFVTSNVPMPGEKIQTSELSFMAINQLGVIFEGT